MVTLSPREVTALFGLDERRVRKDLELGVFGRKTPPRFDVAAVVYLLTLAELGLELGVADRRKLYASIGRAMRARKKPATAELAPIVDIRIGAIVVAVKKRLAVFETWKRRLVTDPDVLGGEPVFPKTRLAVRHVGGMLRRGASAQALRRDYPYLKAEDLELAKLYAAAYPRLGRPRERQAAAG